MGGKKTIQYIPVAMLLIFCSKDRAEFKKIYNIFHSVSSSDFKFTASHVIELLLKFSSITYSRILKT